MPGGVGVAHFDGCRNGRDGVEQAGPELRFALPERHCAFFHHFFQAVAQPVQFQMGMHSSHQFFALVGLGDIVHRAQFKTFQLLQGFRHGADEYDRYIARLRLFFQLLTDFKSAHAGHADVQQY